MGEPTNDIGLGGSPSLRLGSSNVITRVFDDIYAARHPYAGIDPSYTLAANFAENHQAGDIAIATADNVNGGTQRTIFDLGELLTAISEDASAPGGDIIFINEFARLKSALGAVTSTPPDGYGLEIEMNIPEEMDETLITSYEDLSFAEFAETIDATLQEVSRNYLRSYTEILEGAKGYSFTLFYKINKYARNGSERGTRLQSYFVPHYTDIKGESFDFLDTQLRYNTPYEYEILVYRATIGSKYKIANLRLPHYDDAGLLVVGELDYYGPIRLTTTGDPAPHYTQGRIYEPDAPATASPATYAQDPELYTQPATEGVPGLGVNPNPFFAQLDVIIEPSIAVVELPYVASNQPWMPSTDQSFGLGTVLDRPGISPNVDVIPYRAVADKLLFNLSTGAGQLLAQPVALNDDEIEYVNRLRQMNEFPASPIMHANDDPSRSFEVYRLDYHPASYEEFSGARVAIIGTENSLYGYRRADSVSYIDNVEPNRKYYYMFRTLDIHGHPSYPSEVYEIVLIDDDGAIYPKIRVVELNERETPRKAMKSMRRFVQIKPQLVQRLFNVEEAFSATAMNSSAPISDTIDLGYSEEKIWGRMFKIRLTSKTSGKKIDLNVRFTKEYKDQRADSE
jgi:hypothetical protein